MNSATRKPNVFLTGGDGRGWALDTELKHIQHALLDAVQFTDLHHCDIIHTTWWKSLNALPTSLLEGKRIICHQTGEPFRSLQHPAFNSWLSRIGRLCVQSTQAQEQFSHLGFETVLIPQAVDASLFHPLPPDDPDLAAFKETRGIPDGKYIIGNFHRDSEGDNLNTPKLVKGSDLFLEIATQLHRAGHPIHILLAGPRRHWLRSQLTARGAPFTFIGKETGDDDHSINVLPPETLNQLYNLIDVHVISSRSEGGPRTALEAAAAKCSIISTPVGVAPDILDPACIFTSVHDGVSLLVRDIQNHHLKTTVDHHHTAATTRHSPSALASALKDLYQDWTSIPAVDRSLHQARPANSLEVQAALARIRLRKTATRFPAARTAWRRHIRPRLVRLKSRPERSSGEKGCVVLWHEFRAPPWGGGNQFMIALRKALTRLGFRVLENQITDNADAYILNSIQFDVDRFLKNPPAPNVPVLHRLAGPFQMNRREGREQDELTYALNKQFATQTVMQSNWSLQHAIGCGYSPVNPVIIRNAADTDFFSPPEQHSLSPDRKIRLISTSWSDNPRKGGAIYKWMDEHLDWGRFEYSFVGRTSETFANIQLLDPQASPELADTLRQHDIFITASQNDACSNALLEAMSCGLPVLYLDDGGNPELAGFGGLPFTEPADIPQQLNTLVDQYEAFRNLIATPTIDDVAQHYIQAIGGES